ncbi:thioredoxin family protein [Planctomicrobium sp. SH527]|uniref:thioredoxin family protein n=1 Tax=Planctomicrobium sp. SH527 TaxID=3448123 RepID=UPI003F5C754B
MRFILWIAIAAVCFLGILPAVEAGGFNEVLSIGSGAPAWNDLPGTDGRMHSLKDLADKKFVVVVFTCASCPTAVDYETRINELAKSAPSDTAVVAICVNQVAADLLPELTKRAAEKQFQFSYLYDGSQKIAKEFGAVYTPEFYVLDSSRKVIYMGAMDDSTDPAKVTKRYVEEAIKAARSGGEPEVKEMIARGCRVRYARERRPREK